MNHLVQEGYTIVPKGKVEVRANLDYIKGDAAPKWRLKIGKRKILVDEIVFLGVTTTQCGVEKKTDGCRTVSSPTLYIATRGPIAYK